MTKIYATALAGKEMVTVEGTVLGELENIIVDLETGSLVDLVVKPDSDLQRRRYREEGKFILIPFEAVSAVKDFILVDGIKAASRRAVQEEAGVAQESG